MTSYLGIDLSKETFHACLLSDHAQAKKAFSNTAKGFEQLTTWLKNRARIGKRLRRICMVSSGASASSIRPASKRSRRVSCYGPRPMRLTRL
jgi:transposase